MQNKKDIPVLTTGNDSLEIVNTFREMLFENIRQSPAAIDVLKTIFKNGNSKAGDIITYLVGMSPVENFDSVKYIGSKKILHNIYPGDFEYTLQWSDFVIDNLEKDKTLLRFEVQAIFEEEVNSYDIRDYIISAKGSSSFRKKFLFIEVSDWLKEKGFRFRVSGKKNNSGLLYPYSTCNARNIISRQDPEFPNNDRCRLVRQMIAEFSFQIVPIV